MRLIGLDLIIPNRLLFANAGLSLNQMQAAGRLGFIGVEIGLDGLAILALNVEKNLRPDIVFNASLTGNVCRPQLSCLVLTL